MTSDLKKALFYEIIEALEQKIAVSAYYTVELAFQNIGIKPSDATQKDVPKIINAILDIYKEYYPHRIADIGTHLNMVLLQKEEIPKKKRKRFFFF